MQSTEKDLRKYLAPGWTSFVGTAFFGVVFLFAFAGVLRGNSYAVPAALIMGIMTILASIPPGKKIMDVSDFLDDARKRNELELVLQDFQAASSLCEDRIRMGAKFIYGKNCGVYEYSRLQKVYQYIHKTNWAEDGRELRAVMSDGKTKTLCKLALKGKDDENVKKVILYILLKNQSVTVGYR